MIWPMPPQFALFDASSVVLCDLPPSTRIASELGTDDPYTWERPPGSSVWFPLGDGISTTRPQLVLSGQWVYPSGDDAIGHTAEVHRAARLARTVQFRGRHFATLRSDLPATLRVQWGNKLTEVTLTLTLNLTGPLTPEALQEAQQQ